MTCGHCVSSVTEEVSEIPGVTDVQVDLATGRGHRHQRRPRRRRRGRAPPSRRPATQLVSRRPEPVRRRHELVAFALRRSAAIFAGSPLGRRRRSRRSASAPSPPRRRREHADRRTRRRRRTTAPTAGTAPPRRAVPGGLMVAQDGYTLDASAERPPAPGTAPAARSGSSAPTASRSPLRRRARQGPAPDRGPPRPHRLPARAPELDARRHLGGPARRCRPGAYRVFADFTPAERRRQA